MNSFFPCITIENSFYRKKSYVGEFAETIWICYNLQIQKRIVSETILRNTVMENELNTLITWNKIKSWKIKMSVKKYKCRKSVQYEKFQLSVFHA